MSVSAIISSFILLAIVIIVLFFIFYKRASKEIAFVRTGFGGEKVVKSGGAIVVPGLHEVVEVHMNTLRLAVQRIDKQSVITKDRMRVDVVADFFIHVAPDLNAISVAASTLGSRTKDAEALRDIVEGKFVDAIRSIAAEMTIEDLHEQRKAFISKVREAVADDLSLNGLELEAASLTQLDQTDMSHFNPSNAFDAEGLTRLTEKIESRKKTRNDIEQDTKIQIREKNLETEKLSLALEREEHYARLAQQLEVESRKAEQTAEVASRRAKQAQESDQAEILARQKVEIARIISEREIEEERLDRERILKEREIEKDKLLKLAEYAREVEISLGSKQTSQAKAEAEAARAELVTAEERVITAQEREAAERRKAIELIEASRETERKALAMKIMAEAEKASAADRTEAIKIEAEGQQVHNKMEVESRKAEQTAEVASRRAKQAQESDQAEILARQKVEIARIISEREIEEERLDRERILKEREIEKDKLLKIAEYAREVEISLGSKQTSQAKAEAEAARAELVTAEERVITAQEQEAAERRKAIELIEASRETERKALAMKIMADAEKTSAADRTEAIKIEAEGQQVHNKMEVESTRAMNEARNILTPEQLAADVRKYLIDNLPEIIRESVKPIEKIESIKIVQADGLWGGEGSASGTDGIFDSALRFKARAPFVDSLLRDLGLDGISFTGSLPDSGSGAKKKEED